MVLVVHKVTKWVSFFTRCHLYWTMRLPLVRPLVTLALKQMSDYLTVPHFTKSKPILAMHLLWALTSLLSHPLGFRWIAYMITLVVYPQLFLTQDSRRCRCVLSFFFNFTLRKIYGCSVISQKIWKPVTNLRILSLNRNILRHITSLTPLKRATYSASIVEVDKQFCFVDPQWIKFPPHYDSTRVGMSITLISGSVCIIIYLDFSITFCSVN